MDYHTAIERACQHAHDEAEPEARNGNHGGKYLKHLATAEFYRLAAVEDVDIGDRSVGDIAVALMRGVRAVQDASTARR